jgi:hypothetical protein
MRKKWREVWREKPRKKVKLEERTKREMSDARMKK